MPGAKCNARQARSEPLFTQVRSDPAKTEFLMIEIHLVGDVSKIVMNKVDADIGQVRTKIWAQLSDRYVCRIWKTLISG